MTRTTKIVAAALAVIVLGAGSIALAQSHRRGGFGPHGFGRGFGPGGGFAHVALLRQLDATDAQREQIRGIVSQHKDELKAVHERMATARKAQEDAIAAFPTDEVQVRARTSELAAVQADAAVLRARVQGAIFQVLTPEQQEKAKTLRAEREQRREERRKEWEERRQQRQEQRQDQQPPPAVER